MNEIVTIIIVYQDSLPWLHVVLNCLKHYKDSVPKRYLFVENVPQLDNCTEYVKEFLEHIKYENDSKIITAPFSFCAHDGRSHAGGLSLGFKEVKSEYTMFLDADCLPVCDGWLEYLLSLKPDMIGPRPESGINNPHLKLCHPCFLLFKTKLALPPYWTKEKSLRDKESYFGDWGPDELEKVLPSKIYGHKENHFDVCRPFSWSVCLDKNLNTLVINNIYSLTPKSHTVFFIISHEDKKLAIHMRSMSKQWARDGGKYRYEVIKELDELSFCKDQYPLKFKHSYPDLSKLLESP